MRTNSLSKKYPFNKLLAFYHHFSLPKIIFIFNMSENVGDANSESQLQINADESSEQSTHRHSGLLVCIHMCACVCACVCAFVYVCVYLCGCVCFKSMHIVSNRALIIYRGFDTLLFYVIPMAFKAV